MTPFLAASRGLSDSMPWMHPVSFLFSERSLARSRSAP